VSLAIHLVVVSVLALVAVRAAMEPRAGPERYMDFDDAGAEATVDNAPAMPPSAPASGAPSAQPTPEPPAPVAPLARTETSEAPAASDEPASPPSPVTDAWLAPLSLKPPSTDANQKRGIVGSPLPMPAAGGEVKFAGLGSSNARSVVYAVDASGPMVSSLPEVIDELVRSVSRLSATQKFGVVVFRQKEDETETESFMPVLVRATPQAKKEVRAWLLALSPTGRSNPLAGLRTALEMRPDAVFLLSRGIERSGGGLWELGLDATMEELDKLNPVDERTGRRAVVIKTIQFLDEDPTGTMQRIGQVHGTGASAAGKALPGYRVVKRGSELMEEPADLGGR
jgi:hypothetical protein